MVLAMRRFVHKGRSCLDSRPNRANHWACTKAKVFAAQFFQRSRKRLDVQPPSKSAFWHRLVDKGRRAGRDVDITAPHRPHGALLTSPKIVSTQFASPVCTRPHNNLQGPVILCVLVDQNGASVEHGDFRRGPRGRLLFHDPSCSRNGVRWLRRGGSRRLGRRSPLLWHL